jgi:predicted house-cleaning noncanonical NTP pyrophosphatase (MazG superfamily)
LSTYEKRKSVEEYYLRLNKIEAKQQELLTYSRALKKIAAGHQKLTENIDQISNDEMTEQLAQYASDIQDLISAFNKIAK